MDNGQFPALGQAVASNKPIGVWAKPTSSTQLTQQPVQPNLPKKKEKKKPVTLFSFCFVFYNIYITSILNTKNSI